MSLFKRNICLTNKVSSDFNVSNLSFSFKLSNVLFLTNHSPFSAKLCKKKEIGVNIDRELLLIDLLLLHHHHHYLPSQWEMIKMEMLEYISSLGCFWHALLQEVSFSVYIWCIQIQHLYMTIWLQAWPWLQYHGFFGFSFIYMYGVNPCFTNLVALLGLLLLKHIP